jgi:dual oxidase
MFPLFRPGEKRGIEDATDDVISVMRTALTKPEFANALGMRPNDVFVRKMFKIVDKDRDGMISFQVSII